jgi:hypothetical protein
MKKQPILSVLALCFALGAAQFTHAQDLNIDDFRQGAYQSPQFRSGARHVSTQIGSTAHIIGGTRSTNINICATTPCPTKNPFDQPSSYQFRPGTKGGPSAFLLKSGFHVGPRIDMQYGEGGPMQADFSGYKSGWIRLNFKGLAENLNFGILLFTGTTYAQSGCNINAYPGDFSVEAPLSLFHDHGIDYTNINSMDFFFQSGSAIGGVNFLVTSIEVSNAHKKGAISCFF